MYHKRSYNPIEKFVDNKEPESSHVLRQNYGVIYYSSEYLATHSDLYHQIIAIDIPDPKPLFDNLASKAILYTGETDYGLNKLQMDALC